MFYVLFQIKGSTSLSPAVSYEKDAYLNIIAATSYEKDKTVAKEIEYMRKSQGELPEKYYDLKIVDMHSHDVDSLDLAERRNNENFTSIRDTWEKYGIDRTVLFGAVSDPAAVKSDRLTWQYYRKYQTQIYPAFAGFPITNEGNGLTTVKKNLEKGYMQIGELFGASTYSPFASVAWKAKHPNEGILPEVYDLAASYQVPVMLHIDPPRDFPLSQFELAMDNHPSTTFIFAHGNVHTSPEDLRELLSKHENLIIDFFAGYTAYNPGSQYDLRDFTPVVEEYPDRFVLGSDSGFDVGLDNAYLAMYEFIDLLTANAAAQIAYQNAEWLMERQLPTDEQLTKIIDLIKDTDLEDKEFRLNKRQAHELIFQLEK